MKGTNALFCFALASAMNLPALSQTSTNGFRYAVKANVNYTNSIGSGYRIGDLAASVMKKTRHDNFQELELNTIEFSRNKTPIYNTNGQQIGDFTNIRRDVAFRHQYSFTFLKKARFNPQAGISLLNRFQSTASDPSVTNYFPRKTFRWDGILALAPQVRYKASSRFFVDLACPIDFVQFGYAWQKISNPSIPIRQQTNGGFEADTEPGWNYRWQFRLGAGLSL